MAGKTTLQERLARWVPFGLGVRDKPRHFREMLQVVRENWDQLPYAWKILRRGVCDGCSLGPMGLRDNVIPGVHLCLSRLKLLRLNTMPAFDPETIDPRGMDNRELQALGRVPVPLYRPYGAARFVPLSWEEALERIVDRMRRTPGDRMGFFATSKGLTNETYYVFQKLARLAGSNNVDFAARLCHAATVDGLGQTIGVPAPTCSLSDFIGTDLLVLFGTDLANNQPVTTKYMHFAKQAGTRIVVGNPMREKGLERYWIPSLPGSALFGTRLMDDFFQVNIGGDIAFIHGTLKALFARGGQDQGFIDRHTTGGAEYRAFLDRLPWEPLEAAAGLPRSEMERLAQIYASARTAVFVYSMGLTQHRFGVENVQAIVNLCLARGMIGRDKCGIMPIRGHSGVQGGGECGVYPDKFPGGRPVTPDTAQTMEALWGAPVPATPGLKTPAMMEAAAEGKIDFLYSVGGNLLDTLPDRDHAAAALGRIPLRVHQDIVLNTSTLVEGAGEVIVLPAQTRYEQTGGGTSTSTERRIRFTPEIPGHQIGECKPEWEIPALIGRRLLPDGAARFPYATSQEVREEIARVIPLYAGIAEVREEGDWLQWGGHVLCRDGFPKMPDGKARFTCLELPRTAIPEGRFALTTRRGKQFNSIVFSGRDSLQGGASRRDVFMARADAARLGLAEGDPVRLRSAAGAFDGTCRLDDVKPGTLQAYWPEANVLITRRYDPVCGEPDYNALVTVEPRG